MPNLPLDLPSIHETRGYRDENWPAIHTYMRNKGHPRRHRCWCGAEHAIGNENGRWEDYMKPELSGSNPEPDAQKSV